MMHFLPAPAGHLFQGGAGVLKPSIVVPEDGALLIGHPCQLGNVIRQGAEALFTFAESFFGKRARGMVTLDGPTRSDGDQDAQDSSEDENRFSLAYTPPLGIRLTRSANKRSSSSCMARMAA